MLWELLYTDDLVITAEDEEAPQRRVGEWQESLEMGGSRVNVNKTEVLVNSREDRDNSNTRKKRLDYKIGGKV